MCSQSLVFFKEITKCVDDVSPVNVVYLDFQKAILLKSVLHTEGR